MKVEEEEFPVETIIIDHNVLQTEGTTWPGFEPLLTRFDAPGREGERDVSQLPPITVHYRNKRHSLWGHKLWNAAKYLVKRMDRGDIDVRGKTVLELGAGLGLPSLCAHQNHAKVVVVTDYPDEDLLGVIRMNVDQCRSQSSQANCNNEILEVEPLLWGKEEHIKQVMTYTNGMGYDILILSDILFNHVCNDDLAATVAATLSWHNPNAVAYCVFSHHRAHKQLCDFEFFDKCVAKGLTCEQIDQEDYPMMFPEDRGPEEVRQPVKVYRITHTRCPSAQLPLTPKDAKVDVVIQGAGLAQCWLAAALARSRVRVLQCDAAGHYGGPSATLPLDQFTKFLGSYHKHCGVRVPAPEIHIHREDVLASPFPATSSTPLAYHLHVDVLPQAFFTTGETIQQIIDSQLTEKVEFQYVDQFLSVQLSEDAENCLSSPFPHTRSALFSASNRVLSLVDKRRIMQLVKDFEPVLAEGLHASNASTGEHSEPISTTARADACVLRFTEILPPAAGSATGEDFHRQLQAKYDLSPAAMDAMTLKGQLGVGVTSERAMALQGHLFTSGYRFDARTPFLTVNYGIGELAEALSRLGAVWAGSIFALDRSVSRVVADPNAEKAYAVMSSNGQHVESKMVVLPEHDAVPLRFTDFEEVLAVEEARASGVLESKERWAVHSDSTATSTTAFSRVVIIASAPLFISSVEQKEEEESPLLPSVMALFRFAGSESAVVHLVQHTAVTSQVPVESGSPVKVILHFTVDGQRMTQQQLYHRVMEQFFPQDEKAIAPGSLALPRSAVLFASSFTLSEAALVSFSKRGNMGAEEKMRGDVPSETKWSHSYAIEDLRKVSSAQKPRSKEEQEEVKQQAEEWARSTIVAMPTLFPNLLDSSAALLTAKKTYETIMQRLYAADDERSRQPFLADSEESEKGAQ